MVRALFLFVAALASVTIPIPPPAAGDDPPPDPAAPLLGWWEEVEPKGAEPVRLEFRSDRLVFASEQGVMASAIRFVEGAFEMQMDRKVRVPWRLEGDTLTLDMPMRADWKLRRLATPPPGVSLDPLPLGEPREVSPEERAAVAKALGERFGKDQAVRRKAMGRMRPGEMPDPAVLEEMRTLDRENTAFIVELVTKHGWIDAGRFGAEAAGHAFFLVQHSGNIRLMRAILPALEKDAKAGAVPRDMFAMLFDRTRIMLGEKQRYGTQAHPDPDSGELVVSPLEDEAKVDEFRKELGLGPLAEYLATMKGLYGGPVPAPRKGGDGPR